MDIFDYSEVTFGSRMDMGQLGKTLDHIVGASILYDTFTAQNSKWLWIVNDIISAINNDKLLYGVFQAKPSQAKVLTGDGPLSVSHSCV